MKALRTYKIFVVVSAMLVALLALAACGAPAEPVQPTTAPAPATSASATKPATTGAFGNTIKSDKVGAAGNFDTSGKYVSDFGFRSDANGFAFENYGAGNYTNLTPAEMRRFFGDSACESIQGGNCILHPQVKEIMEAWNKSMDGGHCYGFSVAALRFYQNQLNPADFGAPNMAGLKIEGNDKLQREIAYAFAFQMLPPVKDARIAGTPNEVLDKMVELFKPGASAPESWTIGFFKAEGGGGHAVTPYAVEDLGNGIFAALVYDNNWPKATRAILFDRNQNTWSYQAAINPNEPSEVYYGNAETKSLFLYPTNPGTKQLANNVPCFVCADNAGRVAGLAAALETKNNIIFLEGSPDNHAHLLITDDQSRRYGFLSDGKFVREIPGVTHVVPMSGSLFKDEQEPIYYVPLGVKFTLTIDGSLLTKADSTNVIMVGPGYDIGIESINLQPKQKDTLAFSGDGSKLSYKTSDSESPDIIVGIETVKADYAFFVKGVDVEGGSTLNIALDQAKGQLSVNTSGAKNVGYYALEVAKIDDSGEQIFYHDDIELDPNDTMYVEYLKWTGNKAKLQLGIDRGTTGKTTETLELSDDN